MASGSKLSDAIDRHVISPSLLKQVELSSATFKPKRRFLFGLGEPFEPNPWDLDSSDSEEDSTFLLASQIIEEEVSKSCERSNRWGSPKSSARLQQVREGGVPKTTKKQTDWSLSVWSQWASYRTKNLIESDELLYELHVTPVSMTEDGLLFWLPKFVSEARKTDGNLYPPNSVYQICCGLACALRSAN